MELSRSLEGIAAAQHKSVQQLAVERLQLLLEASSSPQVLLRNIQALPHPSVEAVDDLDAAIGVARMTAHRCGAVGEI